MKTLRTDFGAAVETPAGLLPIRYVMGIGQNYAKHAKEMNSPLPERPVLFTKSPAAVIPGNTPIVVPKICQDREQVDYEGELGVVIGRAARDVSLESALDYVLGYAACNDVSARWWQKQGSGGQFCRGKSFDTFCPMSDVTPAASVKNPNELALVTKLNGHVMQDANTNDMVFSVATLISELSRGATLPAGTLILTGTPSGVGTARTPPVYLKDGDTVTIEIAYVGSVTNAVRFE